MDAAVAEDGADDSITVVGCADDMLPMTVLPMHGASDMLPGKA